MKFRSTGLRIAGAAALAAMLVSCGGESLVAFNPARILVFGDQSSVITLEAVPAEGRKYTINAVNADGTFNCANYPLWIQVLATSYGKGFVECPGPNADASGRILAQAFATAGGDRDFDFAGQVTRQLALPAADGGGIGSDDLVTVLVGVNDVVAAFERYEAGASREVVVAQVEQAGVAIVTQVARIVGAGGKVIMSTVPSVALTPYGRSKDAVGTALLGFLTERLNLTLLNELQNSGNNNGRKIGLIEINPYLSNVVLNAAAYNYVNAKDAACVPPDALTCTTNTLVSDTVVAANGRITWLWASALELSPAGHAQLGNLASTRSHNQPF